MIKPVFYIVFLCFIPFVIHTQQNLVVNGDFEEYSSCPEYESAPFQAVKEIERCIGWKAPTYGTSDYFNVCATNPTISVPNNGLGEQHPFNGYGYVGGAFSCYQGGAGENYLGILWWEYVQGKFIAPLEQGKVYKFSMEVSLAEISDLMIDEIGVHLSNTPISSLNTAPLNVIPQIVFYNPNYFSDTTNWVHLETLYTATGGEKYLTIGNFNDSVTTDTLRRVDLAPPAINPYITYFYIDAVNLTEYSESLEISNVFSPNNDGINDFWFLPYKINSKNSEVLIYNRWGNMVYRSEVDNFSWDGKTLKGTLCLDGTYFYRVSNTNITGFIHLIR